MILPKRKHPRLKNYDYSQPGYYYVTIHVEANGPKLSYVKLGETFGEAKVVLTRMGEIAREQLFQLEDRFSYIKVDKYVIMPTHIHMILIFEGSMIGDSQRPTLSDVVCAYKSLTTRECNRVSGKASCKLFQTSFYETVLRNERAYQECWRYIDENPIKWMLDPEDL